MTHEQVRDLLAEHLLGSLDETADARLRRHLRGCGECRAERMRLEEGVAALSHATHETPPPDHLRERVLDVLREEWEPGGRPASPGGPPARVAPRWRWIAAAAAAILLTGSLAWGATQSRRADNLAADAGSYQALLDTLGGREFRLGEIHASAGAGITGTVLLYDGEWAQHWNSWGLVLARGPAELTDARVMLVGEGGLSRELPPLRFRDGEASSWLVTHDDLIGYDELVITSRDGTVLANARITAA